MSPLSKQLTLISGVLIMCGLSFWVGKYLSSKEAFERGAQLERERAAWFRAAESRMFLVLSDSERTEVMRDAMVNGMWSSIIEMDAPIQNPDASPEDRKAASGLLSKLVEYFYNHPKKIADFEDFDIADEVDRGLGEEENSAGVDPAEKRVLGEIRKASKEPMEQLDGIFREIRREAQKFDLETQAVLSRHISQRNFPGRTKLAAGVTFMIPPDSGGSSSSSDEFRFDGKKIRILYKFGRLSINDQDFGRVSEGDRVDLRMWGRVFVNDVERYPKKQEEE